ncbi:hypothetical protein [Aureimonas sp. AU12]|uniref:hypothetical protein n=1 Tax=Aureimonas sp. AU12 TaxID=1638161 RepID=UPI000781BA15|nr:hypothetical protein [Aureimonas sp. AU12]
MTDAERQARRRANLVDPRPARALLVDLAEVDERLAELRRAETPDTLAIWKADLRRANLFGDLAEALGVGAMWPIRQLRQRQRAARGLEW